MVSGKAKNKNWCTGALVYWCTNVGFTLIEVMLTVTILAIGIIGVIRAYSAFLNTLEIADSATGAVCLLKARMFEIEKEAIENMNLSPGAKGGESATAYGNFGWNSSVKLIGSSLEPEEETEEEVEEEETEEEGLIMYLYQAEVTVSAGQPARKLSLASYVDGYAEREASE